MSSARRTAPSAPLKEIGFDLTPRETADIVRGKDFVQISAGPFDVDLVFARDGIASGSPTSSRRNGSSCSPRGRASRAVADSDVDLLVVMRYRGSNARKAAEIVNRVELEFSVDPIVHSPKEVKTRLAMKGAFIAKIVKRARFRMTPLTRE